MSIKQPNVQEKLVVICSKRAKAKYNKVLTEKEEQVLSVKFKNYTRYLNYFQIDKILNELFASGTVKDETKAENPLIAKLKLALNDRAKAYKTTVPDIIMPNLIKSFGDIKKIPSKPVLDKKLVSFKIIEKDIKKAESKFNVEQEYVITEDVKSYENKTITELKDILKQVGWECDYNQTSKTYYLSQIGNFKKVSE